VKIYREIARFIPGDVLYHICEATEDGGDRNAVNRKHRKNLNILSMMGVCRSWNDQIRGLNGLFADIAFDTTNSITISTAAKFLQTVETQSNDLRVYARCITWDGSQAQKAFFSHLRLQSWRFVCFEVEYTSPSFIAYFNLSAPGLLRLVHTSPLPERLFASSFTNLRILDASVKKNFPWPTATFDNLVTLRLKNSNSTRRFCPTSLFDLIGHAHCLEELRLTDFIRFTGGSETRRLICANLKSILFIQCNLKFLLQHLQFPNANSFDVESYGINSDGGPDLPHSRDIGYFAPLKALPIPVLYKRVVTAVTVHMVNCFTDNVYFKLILRCGVGWKFGFTGIFRKEGDWEAYFKSSVNEILRHTHLGATVGLSAFHHLPLSPVDLPPCQPAMSLNLPLFRLPQVALLRTDSSLARDVITQLANLEYMALPNLKCYSFDVETQPTSVDLAPETMACLRSRFNNGSPFALQYWTPDGKAACNIMFSTYTDT